MSKHEEVLEDRTREKLLDAAKHLFAKNGYDATTVKDLAEKAGVNVSLVSYHFSGKEGLYRTCLEQFGRERFAVAKRILQLPKNSEEFKIRLGMYFEELMLVHSEQPELIKILMHELDHHTALAEDIFKNTFVKACNLMIEFFKYSQKEMILRKDLDAQNIATLIWGSMLHACQKDYINEKYLGNSIKNETYRRELIQNLLSMFLDGCLNLNERKRQKQ